jgi:YD repeat-containing protein
MDAQTGRQYDGQGRHIGRIEANGRQYDAQGRYLGRVEGNGRLYDDNGRYTGRIDADGRQYDAQGRYTGRLDGATSSASKSNPSHQPSQPALTVEGNRAVAPFVFCHHGDKDCGN